MYQLDLNNMIKGTIKVLSSIIEERDAYTLGHQQRVAELALAIARRLGLNDSRCQGIRLASLIHDIGKIKIPAEILTRTTPLTETEFDLIKTHSLIGYQILREISFPWPVAEMIKQHHEKLDGSGYPEGLTGDDILLDARIITVADVVEAMNSRRPYRPALGLNKALLEVDKYQGQLYDPVIVKACIDIFELNSDFFSNNQVTNSL